MQRLAVAVSALVMASACGSGAGSDLGAAATPRGTISGEILDTSLAPLDGVTVRLKGGGLATADGGTAVETTTASDGAFAFDRVPAGQVMLLEFSKDGYASAATTVMTNASAGSFPISNANGAYTFTTSRTGATFSVRVLDPRGLPAANARGTMFVSSAVGAVSPVADGDGFLYGYPFGFSPYDATAGADGVLTFSNLPRPDDVMHIYDAFNNYVLVVRSLDENGDGVIDARGTYINFPASAFFVDPSMQTMVLGDPMLVTPFQISACNAQSLQSPAVTRAGANVLASGEGLSMAFSHPVVASSLAVSVTDEQGVTQVPVTLAVSAAGYVATASFAASLQAGAEYNVEVHAISAETGATLNAHGFFFVAASGTPVVSLVKVEFQDGSNGLPADGLLEPGENLYAYFNYPLGRLGLGTLSIGYLNADLNASSAVGDAVGERGYPGTGFVFSTAEYPGTDVLAVPSGYTTRWQISYSGGPPISVGVAVDVSFDRIITTGYGVRTVWGASLTQGMSAPLQKAP